MKELIEGPRRSNLTFVASHETTERVEVDRLGRVRQPVSRSRSGVQGKVADVIKGRSRHAESQNELKAFRILLATAHPDAWQEQPFFLNTTTKGQGIGTSPTFSLFGAPIRKSWKSRKTPRPINPRIRHALP
jgi:hypothetical protein